MSTSIVKNAPVAKSMTRDEKTHRVYSLTWRIRDDQFENFGSEAGPATVLQTPGLPTPGSVWQFSGDIDVWAYCLPNADVKPENPNMPSEFWLVTQTFTTKAIERKLSLGQQGDPMVEPPRISGGFVKFNEEAVLDRFGLPIANSAHEVFRGPQNEWDMARATVRIEQNVPRLDIDIFAPMMESVNDRAMWGFPARFIKLQDVTYREMFHKFSSFWNRTLNFEIWARKNEDGTVISGWDRYILDEGSKVLRGEWVNVGSASAPNWNWSLIGSPNPQNPGDFIRFIDVNGNLSRVLLDGSGKPWIPDQGPEVTACSQCPGGAPTKWVINGFTGSLDPSNPDVEMAYNGSKLSHSSGCDWSYTSSLGATFTLNYIAPNWRLDVSGVVTGIATQTYTKSGTSWACLGGNVLDGAAGNHANAPPTMTLSPASAQGSKPGRRFTQKYWPANYFLLGVPAVIGP